MHQVIEKDGLKQNGSACSAISVNFIRLCLSRKITEIRDIIAIAEEAVQAGNSLFSEYSQQVNLWKKSEDALVAAGRKKKSDRMLGLETTGMTVQQVIESLDDGLEFRQGAPLDISSCQAHVIDGQSLNDYRTTVLSAVQEDGVQLGLAALHRAGTIDELVRLRIDIDPLFSINPSLDINAQIENIFAVWEGQLRQTISTEHDQSDFLIEMGRLLDNHSNNPGHVGFTLELFTGHTISFVKFNSCDHVYYALFDSNPGRVIICDQDGLEEMLRTLDEIVDRNRGVVLRPFTHQPVQSSLVLPDSEKLQDRVGVEYKKLSRGARAFIWNVYQKLPCSVQSIFRDQSAFWQQCSLNERQVILNGFNKGENVCNCIPPRFDPEVFKNLSLPVDIADCLQQCFKKGCVFSEKIFRAMVDCGILCFQIDEEMERLNVYLRTLRPKSEFVFFRKNRSGQQQLQERYKIFGLARQVLTKYVQNNGVLTLENCQELFNMISGHKQLSGQPNDLLGRIRTQLNKIMQTQTRSHCHL
jgi:hypothetical protein